MFDDFLIRALVAGIGVACITGTMGCFVVWRRMAYFGDSLAHSSLLGVAMGIALGISINLGVILVCCTFAFLLTWLEQKRLLAVDTLLGILAHAALSLGIIAISLSQSSIDMHSYLFGDILTVSTMQLVWIYTGGLVVLGAILHNWSALVLMSVHEDLAHAEGVRVVWMRLLLMILMTIVVAICVRIVGILLITSMLILPAATARHLAKTPEAMAVVSMGLGILAVVVGIYGSLLLDTPSGPSIVAAASLFFALLAPFGMRR